MVCLYDFAAVAQSAEHVLGKDEVDGSNPFSSSKENPAHWQKCASERDFVV